MSILAGCAMPPAAQHQTDSAALSTKNAHTTTAFAPPPAYGAALAALPGSGSGKSLADAKPLTESPASAFHQTGRASWYGRAFHGRKTASGERFNMRALTAAHRTLPLGSYVRVSLPATSKSIVVKINDRGPYKRGRVIDLSYEAAKMLGLKDEGVARVNIEAVSREEARAAMADELATNGSVR